MTMDITFTDYFRLTRPTEEQVGEWKDYMGGTTSYTNRGLRVIMEATHAGFLNDNNRLYIPSRMAEGVSTFRTGEKPTKIMKHHDLHSDPVGVIRGARFVPTIPEELEDNPDVQNLMSSSAPIKTQLKSIRNLWETGTFHQDGWRGLGYIQLIGDVYDEKTIDMINDGRFDAVSTNFQSPGGVHCLICGQNWATDGFCEHEWGEMYSENEDDDDGFKFPALPVAGIHQYLETSFVALEADSLVTVDVVDRANTDNNKTVFLPDDFNWEEDITDSKEPIFEFRDFEEGKMAKSKKDKNTLSDVEQEIFNAIKKLRKDTEETILADFAKKISALKDKNGSFPYQEEAKLDDETAIRYALEDIETADQTIDDAKNKEIDNLYQEEFQKMRDEDLLTDKEFEDVKLSANKRENFPKSTFCGPGLSFPAPDRTYAIATQRLVDRYEGPGNKAEILASVNRKSQALGYNDENEIDPKPADIASLALGTGDPIEDISDDNLYSLHLAIEVELVKRGKKMAYECQDCALYKDQATSAIEEATIAKTITQKLEDTLAILREEYARAQIEYIEQVDAHVLLSASIFAEKVERFAQIGVLTGKYVNLSDAKEAIKIEDLEKTEASFAEFDLEAAALKLNDGMTNNNPNETIVNPVTITDDDNTQLPEGLSLPAEEAVRNIRDMVNDGQISNAKQIYATMKKLKVFPDELTFESISAITDETLADN